HVDAASNQFHRWLSIFQTAISHFKMQPGIVLEDSSNAPPEPAASITRLYHQPRSDSAAALQRRVFALIVEEIY
ncbi:MAG: hypothetical protein ACN6PB_26935, partial [Achromobacter kerstersii]|uniref:hypothetical protein n=1 Tax=Achromobacter kerstersii TaxID=1353890 RepID=UPI003D089AF2